MSTEAKTFPAPLIALKRNFIHMLHLPYSQLLRSVNILLMQEAKGSALLYFSWLHVLSVRLQMLRSASQR